VLTSCPKGRERVKDISVDFSGVRLGRDDVGGGEVCFFGDKLVKSVDFGVITVEDLEEGSLSRC
jgi:hypothetical protein